MSIGARIGRYNTSIIAYCDDLMLLSSNEMQMNKLLECCHNFAEKWKMEFNIIISGKSVSFSTLGPPIINFKLGDNLIPRTEAFIYLGLPIGNDSFIESQSIEEKLFIVFLISNLLKYVLNIFDLEEIFYF